MFFGAVLGLTVGIATFLDGGKLLNGHHGPATVLLVLGVPMMAALFLYDPIIGLLDRVTGRTR